MRALNEDKIKIKGIAMKLGKATREAFGLALPELAAATKIWRRMYPSEEYLATRGLQFMKSRWEG